MKRCEPNNYQTFCLLAALLIALPRVLPNARAQEPIPLPPDQRDRPAVEQAEAPAEAEPDPSGNDVAGEQAAPADEGEQPPTEGEQSPTEGEQPPAEGEPSPAPAEQRAPESADPQAPAAADDTGSDQTAEQTGAAPTPDNELAPGDAEVDAETVPAPEEERKPRSVKRLGDSIGTGSQWRVEIPAGLRDATPAEPAIDVRLPDQQLDSQLQDVLVALARDSRNAAAQGQLEALLDEIVGRVAADTAAGRLQTATAYLNALRTLQPAHPQLNALDQQLARAREVASLLEQGEAALAEGRLIEPPDDNARDVFQQVLELDGENQAASDGLAAVGQALIDRALSLGGELEFAAAGRLLEVAEALPGGDAVGDARQRLDQLRVQHASGLQDTILRQIDNGDYQAAARSLDQLATLGGYSEQVRRLRVSLADARAYGGFVPGQAFRDELGASGTSGPEVVVLPAGSFMMGAPPNQQPRSRYQQPYHLVRFSRGFAMSRTEVTVAQFRDFVEATGYITDAERGNGSTVYVERSGRMREEDDADWRDGYMGRPADDDMPVVHVSWNDARAYAEWLASVTGRGYRLPSEAEFEYALRGGTRTLYWWGNGAPPRDRMTNLTGDGDSSSSNRSWNEAFEDYTDGYWGPAPVASFEPNPFGLYDMAGNVREWTLDCWHNDFTGAPADGSAWIDGNCARRVVRGSDWASAPGQSFSSARLAAEAQSRMPRLGFRVARDL